MNIIINISEPIKKVQEFQEYDLGQITTTLQDLLDNSSIIVDSNTIPILKVLSIDNIVKKYLIKDLSENSYNTGDYITGQNLVEGDLLLISGDDQNSGTSINTAFVNKVYSTIMDITYDSANPNFEIDLTGNLDLTITGTSNGDSGLVNLYFSGTEVATINGIKGLSLTGTGVMIPVYFIHDTDGIKWYDAREATQQDLSAYPKYIIKDVTPNTPHTGTTAETIVKTHLIPANSFSSSDMLRIIDFKITKIGIAGNFTIKMYKNTTPNLSGTPTQILNRVEGNTSLYTDMIRSFIIYSGLIKGLNGTQNSSTDTIGSSVIALSASFDTTIDNYLIITFQLVSATDSVTIENFLITN